MLCIIVHFVHVSEHSIGGYMKQVKYSCDVLCTRVCTHDKCKHVNIWLEPIQNSLDYSGIVLGKKMSTVLFIMFVKGCTNDI